MLTVGAQWNVGIGGLKCWPSDFLPPSAERAEEVPPAQGIDQCGYEGFIDQRCKFDFAETSGVFQGVRRRGLEIFELCLRLRHPASKCNP